MQPKRSWAGIVLAILVVFMSLTPQFRSFYSMPELLKIGVGEQLGINLQLPSYLSNQLKVEVSANPNDLLDLKAETASLKNFLQETADLVATKPGEASIKFKLFGLIPVKNLDVDVIPRINLVPGGHAIGILLKTQGVTVVGFSPVVDETGQEHTPGQDGGLETGDVIERINGISVATDQETAKLIHQAGKKKKPVILDVRRGNKQLTITIKPVMCKDTKRFRIGVYIRDSAAGVGTLTFYDPATLVYGALGHVIADVEVNRHIAQGEGKIVNASILGINQARRGQPGEKIGTFSNGGKRIDGDIRKNTNYGIFGFLKTPVKNEIYQEPVPVAFAHQVKPGPAEILTVVEGDKIERFSVEIVRINPHKMTNGKNLLINITDPRLLKLTGGIVQGMSGSPIIQNGYLVGAVTHVLVNEPSKGYGILAEWMLTETELLDKAKETA